MAGTTFRNPILSIWQSAIQQAKQTRPAARVLHQLDATDETAQFTAAALQSQHAPSAMARAASPALQQLSFGSCAKLAAEFAWAEIRRDHARAAALADELRFGTCDPVWATALAIYLAWKATAQTIPYVRHTQLSDFVLPLPDIDLTVALIGDWGTGMDDALWLLRQVKAAQPAPDVLIHLGDIYYSGTAGEVKANFLELIAQEVPTIPVYTLSGNHDMYAGGAPYYWLLSQLNSTPALKPLQQPASYFGLRNSAWQLLALDTGLHDADPFSVTANMTFLEDSEIAWHRDKIANAAGRKTILLSHHQLFSPFDGVGNDAAGHASGINAHLLAAFQDQLGKVSAWYWGHEHNVDIFKPYLGLAKGRCAGASAIPVLKSQSPYKVDTGLTYGGAAPPALVDDFKPLALNSDDSYLHAFAILALEKNGAGRASYYQVDSANHREATLIFQESL